jgi:hypothetical protein
MDGQILNEGREEAIAKFRESRQQSIKEREAAVKKFVDEMPRTYFGAEYREKWLKATVTVENLDGALATFYKRVTKRIMVLIGGASEELLDGMFVLRERITKLEKELAEQKANPPTLADCYSGVWQPGLHKRGDAVTWNGSLFIAQRDTEAKPETSDAWRMAVKRGRDGKDLRA